MTWSAKWQCTRNYLKWSINFYGKYVSIGYFVLFIVSVTMFFTKMSNSFFNDSTKAKELYAPWSYKGKVIKTIWNIGWYNINPLSASVALLHIRAVSRSLHKHLWWRTLVQHLAAFSFWPFFVLNPCSLNWLVSIWGQQWHLMS